jgi:iron complex transport system permease protein
VSGLVRTIGERRVLAFGDRVAVPYRPAALRRSTAIVVILFFAASFAVSLGSYDIAVGRVWATIVDPAAASDAESLIVWQFRIPRILLALVSGAMLGVAGALMQQVTRNGLADPGLIGVSEGASVAILSTVIFYPAIDPNLRPFLGIAGGAAVALLVLLLTKRLESIRFVLLGIGISMFLGAGIETFITYGEISQVQAAMVWMRGSLHSASWDSLAMVAPWAAGGLAAALWLARPTEISMLGEPSAISLGVRTRTVRLGLIAASVALTAASVAAIGTLGFVGLIAPHIARFLIGTDARALFVGSVLSGAALVVIADAIGRLALAPLQVPAGVVMALIGVPFFLVLLWRRRHHL